MKSGAKNLKLMDFGGKKSGSVGEEKRRRLDLNSSETPREMQAERGRENDAAYEFVFAGKNKRVKAL